MFTVIALLVGIALGYGFRGLIGRELRSVAPTVKSDVTAVLNDFKTELAKIVADAKAEFAKLK